MIVCNRDEETLDVANDIASEHVQVRTDRDDWLLEHMHRYCALFLGPRTNVANGDKVIGTNHTLPTRKAGRLTGGLRVGKFLKTHSYQRVTTDEAAPIISAYGSRLYKLKGFVGHAEQYNFCVRRYGSVNVPYGMGAHVTLAARGAEALEAAANALLGTGYDADALTLDITDVRAMRGAIEGIRRLDIVVSSAGLARHTPALDTTPEDNDAVIDVNLRAAYFISQKVARTMQGRGGAILNFSSRMGHFGGIERAVYCASKHAI